jgi:hypothetical protein
LYKFPIDKLLKLWYNGNFEPPTCERLGEMPPRREGGHRTKTMAEMGAE